jgi:hypothetical protein
LKRGFVDRFSAPPSRPQLFLVLRTPSKRRRERARLYCLQGVLVPRTVEEKEREPLFCLSGRAGAAHAVEDSG